MKKLAAVGCILAMVVPLTVGVTATAISQQKEMLLGDINGDGRVDVNDATLIQKYLADYDTPYPIGEPIRFEEEDPFGGEDTITLKVWVSDRAFDLTKRQVNSFKAMYPEKRFSITVQAEGEADAATQIINDPDQAADVLMVPSDMLNSLGDAQVLAPPTFAEEVSVRDSADAVNAATDNGTLYAYPATNDNSYYLVYDNSVVTAQQACSLEGVLAACKKAGKQFIMDCGDGYFSCVFAFTAGVKIDGFEEDDYTQKFTAYDEDEAVATLQAFSKLMHDYKGTFVSSFPAEISTAFKNRKAGAGVDGVWNQAADRESLGSRFAAAKLPTVRVNDVDKQMIPMCGYKYICVNTHTRYPKAAQALANYLAGETCQQQRTEQLQWGPTNKNVQQSTAVTGDPVLTALTEQAAFSVPQVDVSYTFWTPMGTLGTKLYADSTNPANATYFRNLLNKVIEDVRDE